MDFPPPEISMPPPTFQPPPFHQPNFQPRPFHPNYHHHKPYYNNKYKHGMQVQDDFDGKRLRKSVMRKTVDYNASIVKALENRIWQRDYRDRRALQPENTYIPDLMPPSSYLDNPSNAITTRFVKTATNKMRCPVFTLAWTPEGRRLITGASSGEFTLWNGLTFNFETILQAHNSSVRSMVWTHNDNWMVTGDHNGFVKYWQSNMNNVKQFQAHKEPIRGISFCPTDNKFASCSDDGTVRIFDFLRCQEERVLRGHGADVKCVHWHPQKSLVVSGSKDNQQPIKLWDPKSGQALSTLHAHKSTVMDLKWNDNGNWLVTASRDHLLKLFDLRNLKEDMQTFRGHKKEASSVCWHPLHEGLFVSGGSDGQILFWNVGTDKEVGGIEAAHESIVWTLAWHPIGHILCSGSNDHTVKFWTRNRPGDQMRDKYNLNTLPASLSGLDEYEIDEQIVIPGMGIEQQVEDDFSEQPIPEIIQTPQQQDVSVNNGNDESGLVSDNGVIPGLDLDAPAKKPFVKPIPKNFQEQWNVESKVDKPPPSYARALESDFMKIAYNVISKVAERLPGIIRADESRPNRIQIYGKEIDVKPGMKVYKIILDGAEALYNYINSGDIEEINDSFSFEDNSRGSFNQDNATFGNDDFEPQSKRFRGEDFDNFDRENSNSNSGGIPSLLNISVPPPINPNFQESSQKSPTVWDNNSGFNNSNSNSNNGAFNNNAANSNNQKRRQGSRWSSRR